jgi:Rnl2 family RNA ligase
MSANMNAFVPYPSFENHCQAKTVNGIVRVAMKHSNVEWVAIEKVHGANFQMTTDGKDIQCGKRTAWVTKDDDTSFFGFTKVLTKYRSNVFRLFELVKAKYPSITTMTLFGELFGNGYSKDQKTDDKAMDNKNKPVQLEVYYCPHLEFYAFDIRVDNQRFLDYDECVELWTQCGFLFAKALKRGTFQDIYNFDVEGMTSWIPAHFQLPELKDNFAEGIVIKPVTNIGQNYSQFYLKKKQTKFVEVHRGKKPKHFGRKLNVSISNDIQPFIDDVLRYVTPNRLASVISKHGTDMPLNKKTGLLQSDAIQDWKKDDNNQLVFGNMTKPQRAQFYNTIRVACEQLCTIK